MDEAVVGPVHFTFAQPNKNLGDKRGKISIFANHITSIYSIWLIILRRRKHIAGSLKSTITKSPICD